MRSKSRFTTLVLLETRESYLQIRVQSLCTLRGHCRQGPRNIRYQADAYSDRSSTGWIAPACLAHSFDHLAGAGEQRLRGGGMPGPFVLRGARRGHEPQVPLDGPPL